MNKDPILTPAASYPHNFFTPSASNFSTSSLCPEKLSTKLSLSSCQWILSCIPIQHLYLPHLRVMLMLFIGVPCPICDCEHPRALHHERDSIGRNAHLWRWLRTGGFELRYVLVVLLQQISFSALTSSYATPCGTKPHSKLTPPGWNSSERPAYSP